MVRVKKIIIERLVRAQVLLMGRIGGGQGSFEWEGQEAACDCIDDDDVIGMPPSLQDHNMTSLVGEFHSARE